MARRAILCKAGRRGVVGPRSTLIGVAWGRDRSKPPREINPPLIPVMRTTYVVPARPVTEPERSAYEAGRKAPKALDEAAVPRGMNRSELDAYMRGLMARGDPAELRAPLSWPLEIGFLALEAAVSTAEESAGGTIRVVPLAAATVAASAGCGRHPRSRPAPRLESCPSRGGWPKLSGL